MAYRFAPREIAPKAKPEKSAGYLAWLHELPCLISGQSPVEAAHVNYAAPNCGAMGRGKGQKASDRWAVPLRADLHRSQHDFGNERRWWELQGINPHMAALVLWGLFSEHKKDPAKATERATALIRSGLGRLPGDPS